MTRAPKRQHRLGTQILVGAMLLSVCGARADDAIHGRIELEDAANFNRAGSLDAALGAADHNDGLANVRLTYDASWDHWSFDFHYLVTVLDGEDVQLAHVETGLLPPPPATWLSLTDTFANSRTMLAQQSIDRLSLGYSTPDFVIRIGRQALTWGSGIVFRPMDLFDPFSPIATDTEFKPGTDMLYTQYLFADGSDLQFIAVPRGNESNGAPAADRSSFALHYHRGNGAWEITGLLADDHGDIVSAAGVTGPLEGATWNVEALPTAVRRGPILVTALANISDAVTLWDHNATLFAEYFHNGFGVDGQTTIETLPVSLRNRLARGELFDLRRDYLAAGATFEYSPLLSLNPTIIANLSDKSVYLLWAANWSLSYDLVLIAGAQAPIGPRGSEFGGLPLSPGSPIALSPPAQLYLQLRRYF